MNSLQDRTTCVIQPMQRKGILFLDGKIVKFPEFIDALEESELPQAYFLRCCKAWPDKRYRVSRSKHFYFSFFSQIGKKDFFINKIDASLSSQDAEISLDTKSIQDAKIYGLNLHYSPLHISWNEVFSKILKKPFTVQK